MTHISDLSEDTFNDASSALVESEKLFGLVEEIRSIVKQFKVTITNLGIVHGVIAGIRCVEPQSHRSVIL